MSEKQTGLEGPSMAAVYHSWFEKGEQTEATYEQKIAILEGKAPLPPAARVIFDVEPLPRGIAKEDHLYWPTWHFVAKDESGAIRLEGDLNNEHFAVPDFVSIQAPERPQGMWQTSSGYRLLAIFDALPFKGSIEVSAYFGDGSIKSSVLTIPWVSQK